MVILIILLIIAAIYIFLIKPGNRAISETASRDYAHRGLHADAPENSLAAFEAAAKAGYGIELDVQLSKDDEVYVFHDYSLERMTGCKAKLSELTSDELDSLRLDCGEERIPRLSQVLELVGGRVPLLVELKGESTDASLCPKADELLAAYSGEYIVESFNPMLLYWYRRHRPEIRRGQLYTNVVKAKGFSPLNLLLTLMAFNFLAKPDFIAYDKKRPNALPVLLTTRLFRCRSFVWTVQSADEYEKYSEKGSALAIFESFLPEK